MGDFVYLWVLLGNFGYFWVLTMAIQPNSSHLKDIGIGGWSLIFTGMHYFTIHKNTGPNCNAHVVHQYQYLYLSMYRNALT